MDYKGGTGALIKALEDHSIDIGILLTEGAVKAIAHGSPNKIIQVYVNSPLYWGVYTGIKSKFNSIDEIRSPVFCISRYGSGSHLMAYYLAEQEGWDTESLTFVEIGNFSGALREFNAQPDSLFMWERFMTKPYVDSQVLKKLTEVPTPWPSFSIVVRDDVISHQSDVILKLLELISCYTYKFKQNTQQSIDYLSHYFDFSIQDMKDWIQTTDWNYVIDIPNPKTEKAISFLKEMKLIPEDTTSDMVCVHPNFWRHVAM